MLIRDGRARAARGGGVLRGHGDAVAQCTASRRAQRPRPRRLLLPTAGRTLAARRRRLAFADNDDTTLAADCQAHRPATAPSASRLSRSSCCRRRLAAHWPVGPSRLQARAMPSSLARCRSPLQPILAARLDPRGTWSPPPPHRPTGWMQKPAAARSIAGLFAGPGRDQKIDYFFFGIRYQASGGVMRRPKPSSARVFSELVGHLSSFLFYLF